MNEVVPSGVLLQRLIQNSHTDILNREKNNDRFMHLYHIGTYWVAFERSACRLCGLFPKSELSLFCVPGCPEYVAENKKPPIEGRWHEERVTEGWLLAKSKIKYGYIQNCKQMRWCCYLKICK